ncbi:MAG: alpha-1,2-fucosyltransferase [Akkermansia sp.]|nr:alpha-1,2-fucosyltransferase [Akkermansia sp.]
MHFRVGYDYFILGYKLHKSYWQRAAETVRNRYPNVLFVCVYDKFTSDVKFFMEKFPCEKYHGSLVDDIAMIIQGDINIVSNSSFSIMGALLNPRSCMAVCPSIYPTPIGNLPDNTYAKSWIRISGTKRDLASQMAWNMRKIAKAFLPINLLKKLLKK